MRELPGSVDGPGLLHEDDERAIVTFQRLLHHPIEEVWAAITDPEELETWSLVKVSREPSHGRLEMRYTNGLRAGGRVLEWNPPGSMSTSGMSTPARHFRAARLRWYVGSYLLVTKEPCSLSPIASSLDLRPRSLSED